MKQLIAVSVFLGILGGLLIHSYQIYKATPLVYAQEEEIKEPREVLIEPVIDWTKERINQEIEKRAQEYGVSASDMKRVMMCESGASTTIQSFHLYTEKNVPKGYNVGDREQSFGLFQIHLPAHTDVSKEEATDPAFAIEWSARKWKTVNWSCK